LLDGADEIHDWICRYKTGDNPAELACWQAWSFQEHEEPASAEGLLDRILDDRRRYAPSNDNYATRLHIAADPREGGFNLLLVGMHSLIDGRAALLASPFDLLYVGPELVHSCLTIY
jgi:hypothetical protein